MTEEKPYEELSVAPMLRLVGEAYENLRRDNKVLEEMNNELIGEVLYLRGKVRELEGKVKALEATLNLPDEAIYDDDLEVWTEFCFSPLDACAEIIRLRAENAALCDKGGPNGACE